jgi:fused signal recognition particle receptor
VITKLDGTARGGVVVGITEKYKLPLYYIGVGESKDDLQPFLAVSFSRAIVGLES